MVFLRKIFFFQFIILLFSSCSLYLDNLFHNTNGVDDRAAAISDFYEDYGRNYTILLVSDAHFEANYERNEKLLNQIMEMSEKPVACFVLGDLTRNCTQNEFNSYLKFCDELKEVGIAAVYAIPGNHDCDDGGTLYLRNVYPYKSYYRLNTNKFSYYFLDSAEGSHGNAQIENLKQIIKSDKKYKIIFSHYPLYAPESFTDKLNKVTERAVLISLLAKNNVLYYFCGHTHEFYTCDFGKFTEVILGDLKWSKSWALLSIDENTGYVSYVYKQ